ncbi:pyruvate formate-lyase-activating protein [Luedemannella flava]|uniref:Pyruvate formate-lyase-activating enzyme n=1 Tax=Luedemannella flava TaxID=349316 RepID=A0ABN2MHI1_9ACTN
MAADPATSASVHSWDISTGVDGPGTRFVLFLSGCPLRCQFCQNPDTWHMRDGNRMSLEEVMREVRRYERFLHVAHGGVTCSGGEPLLQSLFVTSFFHSCKDLGLHTALDTAGLLGVRADADLLAGTDLVLLDIKSYDPDTYRLITGKEVAPTLAFARRLADLGKAMWIRFVLVPGLSDDPANVAGLADFVAGLGPVVQRVEVLPYHRLGVPKWAALGRPYPLAGTPAPTPEQVSAATASFAERQLPVLSA